MKISIIGTHSTGKTNIISALEQALVAQGKTVTILKELARECPFPINESTTLEAQSWILDQQIAREAAIDHDNHVLITDRASLDNFAYMYRAVGESLPGYFEEKAAHHMGTYDIIFKTQKLDIDAKKDKVRSTDFIFRDMIDWMILHLLEKNDVPFVQLAPTTDYMTHVGHILSYIQSAPHFVMPHKEAVCALY
ncbi:ATP-binding protein [Patescibacteria group bacterium]|nr:ATP-binding protein [Patescibacteria group bacterium]